MKLTRSTVLRPLSVCAVLAALALAWTSSARSQINAAPSWVPIGVSQAGGSSVAWFHEPGSRQALACQATAAPSPGVQCATVRLP